jgi:peptidoglycan biosynthesis protein MviN/MurJ (putative lipid II flippase)
VAGLLILLLVDFIWVASSELTEYIFKNQNFRNVLLLFSCQFVRVSSFGLFFFTKKT